MTASTRSPASWWSRPHKGIKPGVALDVGMGQGRNAVYLAQQGWTVTGLDTSAEAVAAAAANAAKAGVHLDVVKAGHGDFDFGSNRWDLIVMTFAWVPVTDPTFVGRVHKSLRPGGRVIFEHFIDTGEHPAAKVIKALKPCQTVLDSLVEAKYLNVSSDGQYTRQGDAVA